MLYAIVLLGFLNIGLWHTAFGRCKKCNNDRYVRCGCDPENKRKPWKNQNR
jgi:hypothetical protein